MHILCCCCCCCWSELNSCNTIRLLWYFNVDILHMFVVKNVTVQTTEASLCPHIAAFLGIEFHVHLHMYVIHVCVCVCVRARACVCVCVCTDLRHNTYTVSQISTVQETVASISCRDLCSHLIRFVQLFLYSFLWHAIIRCLNSLLVLHSVQKTLHCPLLAL